MKVQHLSSQESLCPKSYKLKIRKIKDLKNIKCQSDYFFDKRIKQSTIVCWLRLTEMLQSAGSSQYCTMQIFSFVLTFSML